MRSPDLSVIYVNQGDYAKGEAELEMLLQRNPDDPGPNNDLGYLYAEQGKNLEKAESMIRKALQEEPDELAYLDSLGWVLFKRGKLKEALEPLKKAVERMKVEERRSSPRRDDPRAPGRRVLPAPGGRQGRGLLARRPSKVAAKTVPPDKRLAEIRKKLESLGSSARCPSPRRAASP